MTLLTRAWLVQFLLLAASPVVAQSSKPLFEELRDAGGVHPLAQLVCFPAAGQDQDTTFILVAFSKEFASTLRAKGEPIPKSFLDAEKASEKDRFILQWVFRNGVPVQKDPEMLNSVPGSSNAMWSAEFDPPGEARTAKKFTLRMVFSRTGRYSRDVLVDNRATVSISGRCEAVR